MTGSRNTGPLQPPEYFSPVPRRRFRESEDGHCHQPRRKMTPVASPGQPIQLTPLWEHVVRTRKFPTEVDVRSTFIEISGRLRDPEWEVRQHALRVLVDVLPTLDVDVMDKVMQPVVPELINNLGHSAPAIRKGALDTLRVYVLNSRDRDSTVQRILHEGLNRCGAHDVFQTNVTTGVILSAPSLLFPSSSSPRPSASIIREVTTALASRLVQVTHQEAVVKSLLKIREAIGQEEFDAHVREYDEAVLKHLESLSEVYDVKPRAKSPRKRPSSRRKREKIDVDERQGGNWESDSDTSGIVEEEDEVGTMPPARVVLETEIKFNEETAITMTILEEKDEESDNEGDNEEDEESGTDLKNDDEKMMDAIDDELNDRRRTPRRVHFGGEVVKLRTPDSDETGSIGPPATTRIPLPVSPATKLPPKRLRRRSSSQPEMGKNVRSPVLSERRARRKSRSVSNSPRKERYVHNADISPKKGILSRPSSPVFVIKPLESQRGSSKKTRNAAEKQPDETKSKLDEQRDTKTPAKSSDDPKVHRVSDISSSEIEGRNVKEESTLVRSSGGSLAPQTRPTSLPESERTAGVKESSDSSPKDGGKSEHAPEDRKLSPEAARNSGNDPRREDDLENPSRSTQRRKSGKPGSKYDSVFGSPVDEEPENRSPSALSGGKSNSQVPAEADVNASESPASVRKSAAVNDEVFANSKSADIERNSGRRSQGWAPGGNRNEGIRSSSNGVRDNESAGAMKPTDNVTCSSSESEDKCQEPSWEELGLVGQDVLEDLHNKEDWRARARGLERVASALRTPSALATVEPRLGSLLHTALGGERSCRVAAAGLSVAKVVIAGASEAALKRRLPQLAWGLARQGGPSAAQLARIAMLRLKPALFLEQLLQPQCLGARNAKTRENALQLLIFSLVTFPSTEFTLDGVAGKVVAMVCDRRRRVRQAALDTLAVLAQVYDAERVIEAGKKEAKSRHDGESMIAAIRARLARKSLPLVSADGLVVYGLQISPTVQIVTGPDVDWIVAGSGSVSPGTGRSRGQIIATSANVENDKQLRNESGNPWTNKSNLVALGVGLRPEAEPPVAWQFVSRESQDDLHSRDEPPNSEDSSGGYHKGRKVDVNLNSENASGRFYVSPKRTYNNNMVEGNGVNYGERIANNFERNRSDCRMNDSYVASSTNYKTESRIPVLNSRGTNTKLGGPSRDKPTSLESINESFRKGSKEEEDSNGKKRFYQEDNAGFRNMYQRRKQLQQENNGNPIVGNETVNESLDSSFGSYRPVSYTTLANRESRGRRNESFAEIHPQVCPRLAESDRFSRTSAGNPRPYSMDPHQQIFPRSLQQTVSTHDAYNSYYQQQRRNLPFYRALQTAPGPLARAYQQYQNSFTRNDRNAFDNLNYERGMRDASSQRVTEIEQVSTDAQTNNHPFLDGEEENPFRRRLRSLSPSQLYRRDQLGRLTISKSQATSMYNIDKSAVNEDECNERNKHNYSSQTDAYQIRPPTRDENRLEDGVAVTESNSSTSSDASTATDQGGNVQAVRNEEQYDNSDSRSSSAQSQNAEKAFDVITGHSSPMRNSTEPTVIPLVGENDIPGSASASIEEVMSKEWSSEDEVRSAREASRSSDRVDFLRNNEENDTDDTFETAVQDGRTRRRTSIVSIHSPTERSKTPSDTVSTKYSDKGSPEKSYQPVEENSGNAERMTSPSRRKSLTFEQESDTSDEKIVPSVLRDESVSFRQLNDDEERHEEPAMDSNNSNETAGSETKGNSTRNTGSVNTESSTNENLEEKSAGKDVAFSTIPPHPLMQMEQTRRLPSKVPRSTMRKRSNSNKARKPEKSVERTKPMVQQCFAQLESKDWEVTMKGLKSLSQIAKQHPEYLDLCMAGTVSRLLGRHVKNLRSQVARAACMSAADLFSAQIRGVDQDLDDIAGPLLHRTADTNRFLRADCNAALDKMVEHLPPHKTIAVIVHRGANHQNAIVRAATARLLAQVVDRIGPDHAMILPRDVREKLIATGAKLLIDGNLDARNHAKKMFRRLTRCEGFRKALTDSVSESTLRHIDKTLKSL